MSSGHGGSEGVEIKWSLRMEKLAELEKEMFSDTHCRREGLLGRNREDLFENVDFFLNVVQRLPKLDVRLVRMMFDDGRLISEL